MDLIGGVLGLVVMAAVLIGVPMMRERIRISRLRREWYARGRGYAQGKYSVARHPSYYADPAAPDRATGVDPAAPMFADPPTSGSMFKVAAGVLLVCMVCGGAWMAYDVGAHHAALPSSDGVAVASQRARVKANKHTRKRTAEHELADATCVYSGMVPATDGKCYSRTEPMPQGVKAATLPR